MKRKPPKRRKSSTFKGLKRPRTSSPRESLWDLDRDGITYSMLAKFVICRERMRLSAVEGWTESNLKDGLEFGNGWHHCEQFVAEGGSLSNLHKATKVYEKLRKSAKRITPNEAQALERLLGCVEVVFPKYYKYWESEERMKHYLIQEEIFDVQYPLPGLGRSVRIRGRMDGSYRWNQLPKRLQDLVTRGQLNPNAIWLKENKTKGNIDQDGLKNMLEKDLQTMLYMRCFNLKYPTLPTPAGVLYNVIRRPLLKQGQSESLQNYLIRVGEDVDERPEHYFMRWETLISQDSLDDWCRVTLDPALSALCLWWDSIKHSPFEPWTQKASFVTCPRCGIEVSTVYLSAEKAGYVWCPSCKTLKSYDPYKMVNKEVPNPHHFLRPFGVYDSGQNGRGDFFDLLTRGSKYGLHRRTDPFPELVED